MKKAQCLIWISILVCGTSFAQNIGIGTSNPTETLEVAGTIYSSNGGIKFPDATIQMTAAANESVSSVAQPRLLGYLKFEQIDGEITLCYSTYPTLTFNPLPSLYN